MVEPHCAAVEPEHGKTSTLAALRPHPNHILSRYLTRLALPILFPTADSRFNLEADLGESNDLAAREPAKLSELARALTQRLREMGARMPLDPATKSPLPAAEELLEQAGQAAAAAPGSSPEGNPLRVACMGDSITFGVGGIANRIAATIRGAKRFTGDTER